MHQWISVKDRFPEDGVTVLTEGNQGLCLMQTYSESDGWFWCDAELLGVNDLRDIGDFSGTDYEPTHWMPLPEPPEAEKETKRFKPDTTDDDNDDWCHDSDMEAR